jgi:hypothetical protein
MADADDDPTTNIGAAAAIRDLVAQVRAHAAAHDLLTDDVLAQIRAQLTNAPADVAEPPATPPPQAPSSRSPWLTMSYARRKELREKHRAIVAEAPAAPYAETLAFWEKKRVEVAAVVEREGLPSVQSALITDLVLAHAAHLSPSGTREWLLAAILRSLDAPGSLVRDLGLLDPLHDLRAELSAAARRLSKSPNGGRPRNTAAALMDGMIGGAMAGLLLGGVIRGATETEKAAGERVRHAWAAEGFDLGEQAPRQAYQACRRLERAAARGEPLCQGDQTLARETFDVFQTVQRGARTILDQKGDKGVWPLEERETSWLAPLAYGARTRAT